MAPFPMRSSTLRADKDKQDPATWPAIRAARFLVGRTQLVDSTVKRLLLTRSPFVLFLRRHLAKETWLDSGKVSVVVPIYNVEPYLQAALDSIRYQRYYDLQVIMVDDGSTDGSSDIARGVSKIDPRFVLLETTNAGPGHARNIGAAHADGVYICFADGDDLMPVGAISRLVQSLTTSNASFAVGAFEHLREDSRWRSAWVAREHAITRLDVTLSDVPGITRNVFPWNKLFNRKFYEQYVGPFPEGIVYEDQVPTARAFSAPATFNVLSETMYHWRQRSSEDSITQNRSDDDHLEMRVRVLAEVEAIYAAGPPAVYREWIKKSLFEDMRPFYTAAEFGSDRYKKCLRASCINLWEKLTDAERSEASPNDFDRTQAILNGDFELLFQLNRD